MAGPLEIFPKDMGSKAPLSLDTIKAHFNYFELQAHELHWQTFGLGEHLALGDLYELLHESKDEFVEKIMGYTGVRTKAMPVETIKNYEKGFPNGLCIHIMNFAKQLEEFGSSNNMPDVENLAQGLSGDVAKIRYRLTLT